MPVVAAVGFPIFFIPICYDAYVLPRAALAIAIAAVAIAVRAWAPPGAAGRLGVLALPAVAVVAAVLVALALSVNVPVGVIGAYGRYESAPMRLAYLALFAAAAWGVRTPRQRWWLVTAFIAGCAVAGGEALFEAATRSLGRPDGNLGQANLLGALLAMAIPLTFVRTLDQPPWALLLVPLVGGLLVSTSRSGWLGALAGIAVLLPLLARDPRIRRAGVAAAAIVPVAALALILLTPLARLNSDVGTQRLHVWWDALHLVAARPLFGWGEDTFGLVFGRFVTGDWEPGNVFDRAHQFAIDILATQGVAGLAACTWFWAVWLWFAVRCCWSDAPDRRAVAGFVGAWAGYLVTVSDNFDWVAATAPVWLLAGAAWSAAAPAIDAPAWLRPSLAAGARAGLALATSVTALGVAVGLAILPVAADLAYYSGDAARATRLDPLQAEYHRQLGAGYLADGRDGDAVHELAIAARLGDNDSDAFIDLGDAYAGIGDPLAARAAYARAVQLNPFDARARARLASASR